jgi:ADP-ribose pyrophosphatase
MPGTPEPDPPEYLGRLLRVRRERFRLPDGREVALDAVRYRNVAVVVPLLPDGRVVLLRQVRPIIDDELWEVPAGTIEPGESPEACARRELREEAGYDAGRLLPLGEAWADPGPTDERMFLFAGQELVPAPRALDADEHIRVDTRPLPEVYRMIEAGEIVDAGTLIALLRLREARRGQG